MSNEANKPEQQSGKLSPRIIIPETTPPAKRGFRLPLWLWLGLAVLFLLGAGLAIFRLSQEARVTFKVDAGDLQMTDQPMVIYNLMGKVELLRSDYARRTAPVNTEYAEVQNHLTAACADLAGKLEAKRLLKGEENRLGTEIPDIISQNQSALEDLWITQGAELDKEYADTKEEYQQKLELRARELGVDYQRNKEIDSIDVSVNAFKLALYNAPKTVKSEEERKYAEGLLAEWQKYQEDWQKRLGSMKEQSQEIRQRPGPKINEVKKLIGKVTDDLQTIDADIAAYQQEVREHESRLAGLDGQVQQITRQFVADLLNTPKDFVKTRLKLNVSGMAELTDLENHKQDFPPGDYFLLVSAQKDGEIYWALKKFAIREHRRETVYIQRRDFVLARSYLSGQKP
jgi:predicted outer membrane protein